LLWFRKLSIDKPQPSRLVSSVVYPLPSLSESKFYAKRIQLIMKDDVTFGDQNWVAELYVMRSYGEKQPFIHVNMDGLKIRSRYAPVYLYYSNNFKFQFFQTLCNIGK
jgi:hypothetical protein